MKTAISVPDETFARVDRRARALGVSRSEFFTHAAIRWLDLLEDEQTTAQIDAALASAEPTADDAAFTRRAATRLVDPDERW